MVLTTASMQGLVQPEAVDQRVERARFIDELTANEEAAEALQALHDVLAILGFDHDGDKTPWAEIAGAGSVTRYVETVLTRVRQAASDNDELLEENGRMSEALAGGL